jgi:hypothetical protein
MRKRRIHKPEILVDDSINPGIVNDIKVRELYYGEIQGILRKKLVDPNKRDLAEALLNKVKVLRDRGCWVIDDDWSQYSSFNNQIGHRLAYKLFVGNILGRNLICHECDRKGCIYYEHLFQGTYQDNREDFVIKYKKYMLGRRFGDVREVIPWNQIEAIQNEKVSRKKFRFPEHTGTLLERLRRVTGKPI